MTASRPHLGDPRPSSISQPTAPHPVSVRYVYEGMPERQWRVQDSTHTLFCASEILLSVCSRLPSPLLHVSASLPSYFASLPCVSVLLLCLLIASALTPTPPPPSPPPSPSPGCASARAASAPPPSPAPARAPARSTQSPVCPRARCAPRSPSTAPRG